MGINPLRETNLEIKKENKEIYIVDGREFISIKDAENYKHNVEYSLKNWEFYEVIYEPEIYDDYGDKVLVYGKSVIIALEREDYERDMQNAIILHVCIDNFKHVITSVYAGDEEYILAQNFRIKDRIIFDTVEEIREYAKENEGHIHYIKNIEEEINNIDLEDYEKEIREKFYI